MGGYNFDLGDEENLMLDAPLVDDVAAATSAPMVSAAPDKIAPVAAPAPNAGVYGDDFRKYWADKLKHGMESSNFSSKEPVKVSTAPDWYKGGPPPGGNDWAKALIGTASGMISGPAQVAMQNPLRPLGQKMQDAKQVALGQGLGALLGGLVGKKQTQYENELDAAKKQASMTHVSAAGQSAGEKEASLAAKALGLANQSDSTQSLIQNRLHQQGEVDRLHDPNASELQAQKELLVSQGVVKDIHQLDGQTLFSLHKDYPVLNTLMQGEGRAAQDAAKAENERNNIIARENAASEAEVQKRENEDTQKLAQADLGHGFGWRGGIPPDEATQRTGRDQLFVRNYAFDALDRMKAIQDEMDKMSHGFSGTFDQWMGSLVGTPQAVRAQELATQAEQIQNNLKIMERQRANMGVPQIWEDQVVTAMNPRAGSLAGWLKGRAAWKTMQNELDHYTRAKLDSVGIVPLEQAGARPQYQKTAKPVAPIAKVKDRQVVHDEEMPEVPADGLPPLPVTARQAPGPQDAAKIAEAQARAGKPAAPAAAAIPTKYKVTAADGSSFERVLTPEQYQKAIASKKYKLEVVP